MKTKQLAEILERVESWPAHAQDKLAEIAREIEEDSTAITNRVRPNLPASTVACATPIKDALQLKLRSRRRSPNSAADEGCLHPRALRHLDEIADWLAVHYPTIAPAVAAKSAT